IFLQSHFMAHVNMRRKVDTIFKGSRRLAQLMAVIEKDVTSTQIFCKSERGLREDGSGSEEHPIQVSKHEGNLSATFLQSHLIIHVMMRLTVARRFSGLRRLVQLKAVFTSVMSAVGVEFDGLGVFVLGFELEFLGAISAVSVELDGLGWEVAFLLGFESGLLGAISVELDGWAPSALLVGTTVATPITGRTATMQAITHIFANSVTTLKDRARIAI
ncbi:12720_t:CDS:2, partial [Ambispora leptoticha]